MLNVKFKKKKKKHACLDFIEYPLVYWLKNTNTNQDVENKSKQTLNTRSVLGLTYTSFKYKGTLIDRLTWIG